MSKKILAIISTAYRATLEEQDDTAVWLTHVLKEAGADVDVVLRGTAVNYAVKGQDASGLAFGEWRQTQPPRLDQDLAGLGGKGVRLLVCQEDLVDRGIDRSGLIDGIEPIARAALPRLFESYDQIWQW
jgi:intracellular sulfur oxidation DsrE/DsrF family protein